MVQKNTNCTTQNISHSSELAEESWKAKLNVENCIYNGDDYDLLLFFFCFFLGFAKMFTFYSLAFFAVLKTSKKSNDASVEQQR